MHHYHGTEEHQRRLERSTCRCGSTGVVYNLAELVVEGRVRHPADRSSTLTTGPIGLPDKTNVYIYAVGLDYRIHVAPDGDRSQPNAVKHETLFHNDPVLAAGEVWITEGEVVAVNDHSGSYRTRTYLENDPQFARDLLEAMNRNGIPVGPVVLAQLSRPEEPDEL
jgi:hypothetical protein